MRALNPGDVFANHRIDGLAGRGGMGVVYRATDLRLQRTVALKVIADRLADDPDFRARFERESQTAASIRHPNVITVYAAGEDEGALYITMELIEGTDLRQLIEQHGALQPAFAAHVVSQVAEALDSAHVRALIHRDVKPANVLLAEEGGGFHAYLTDFGLTKRIGGPAGESGQTQVGTFVGTLDYIAPEQLRGEPVDRRTDVYSLACVLFETLTGQVPYPRDSEPAKMFAHMGEAPPAPRGVVPTLPLALDEVVRKGMAKDPAQRYQTAGELGRAALQAAGVRPPGEAAAAKQARTRRGWALIGAGVAALIAVGAVLAIALGGGGGGGGSTPVTTPATAGPTPDFDTKVGAICRDRLAQVNAYNAQIQRAKDSDTKKMLLVNLRDAAQGLHDQLAELVPPATEASGYHAYIVLAQQTTDTITRGITALDNGDTATAQRELQSVQTLGDQLDQQARQVPALQPCAG
jgi:hypothetical protein